MKRNVRPERFSRWLGRYIVQKKVYKKKCNVAVEQRIQRIQGDNKIQQEISESEYNKSFFSRNSLFNLIAPLRYAYGVLGTYCQTFKPVAGTTRCV